jgi:hypothetical protein
MKTLRRVDGCGLGAGALGVIGSIGGRVMS